MRGEGEGWWVVVRVRVGVVMVRGSEEREWSQSTEEVAERAGALEPTHHRSELDISAWVRCES